MPDLRYVEDKLSLSTNEASTLGLSLGGQPVNPGERIPRAEAQSAPQLSLPSALSSGTYIIIALDIDAPLPSLPLLGPILHWIQPSLTGPGPLTSSVPFIANYIGPAPPPGSAPHRYVFLAYEQPEALQVDKYTAKDGKKVSNWKRMRFDLKRWEKEMGLGKVVASNFFLSN